MKMRVDSFVDIITDARHYANKLKDGDLTPTERDAVSEMLLAYANCLESFQIDVEKHCIPFASRYNYEF